MNTSNHIEALLFLSGEPLDTKRLCELLKKDEKEIDEAINELEETLKNRGIRMLKKDGQIMLGTAPESSEYCQKLAKEELEKNMGRAGLETLAIVLYKDGVGKPEIDQIRGVNSSFTLRNLMIKGLVDRKINPEDKRSFIYKPTLELFRYLGVAKKEELPEFKQIKEELKNADNHYKTD